MEYKYRMRKLLSVILAFVLLSACAPSSTTLSPSALAAPADDAHVATSCASIYAAIPADARRSGSAVIDDYHATGHLYLVNFDNGKQSALAAGDETLADPSVSPNRKALAYKVGDPKTNAWSVVVSDAQGTRQKSTPWQPGFFIMGNWVNDKQLLLTTNPPITIFDPFDGTNQGFQYTDFPNYSQDTTSNRIVLFDASLGWAVYRDNDGKVDLFDMAAKKVLGSVNNPLAPFPVAAWSPDGSRVAVVGKTMLGATVGDTGDDLFSISREGQVTQLTHLTEHYGKLLTINSSGLAWSPDSRYLAFWIIYPQHGTEWQLAIHDTLAQKTTAYCIVNNANSQLGFIHPLPAPIWSPDGKQLMLENRYDQVSNHVLILDPAQKTAFPVFENMYPVGWMVSGP